jgi:hypothetical protein
MSRARAGSAALQALHWAGAVSVAQLVELLVVVQAVAGSNPVAHPHEAPANAGVLCFEDRTDIVIVGPIWAYLRR